MIETIILVVSSVLNVYFIYKNATLHNDLVSAESRIKAVTAHIESLITSAEGKVKSDLELAVNWLKSKL